MTKFCDTFLRCITEITNARLPYVLDFGINARKTHRSNLSYSTLVMMITVGQSVMLADGTYGYRQASDVYHMVPTSLDNLASPPFCPTVPLSIEALPPFARSSFEGMERESARDVLPGIM